MSAKLDTLFKQLAADEKVATSATLQIAPEQLVCETCDDDVVDTILARAEALKLRTLVTRPHGVATVTVWPRGRS
jgi:hypothetical protein